MDRINLSMNHLTRLSPGFLYFVSGLFASAGINLVTSIPTASGALVALYLLLAAVPWVFASWILAAIAAEMDSVTAKVADLKTPTLSSGEFAALREQELAKVAVRFVARSSNCMLACLLESGVLSGSALKTLGCRRGLPQLAFLRQQ